MHILKEPVSVEDGMIQIGLESELTEGHQLPKNPKIVLVKFNFPWLIKLPLILRKLEFGMDQNLLRLY